MSRQLRSLVVLVVVTTSLANLRAQGQPKIYWTNSASDTVMRANLDGSEIEELVPNQPFARGIAVDTGGGKVYWAIYPSVPPERINRANLEGTGVEHLMFANAQDLALAPAQQSLYWVTGLAIKRANLDGSNVEVLVEAPGLGGLALDPAAGKMYWTAPWEDKIQRADLDGSNVEDLVTSGLSAPYGIALDTDAGKMYWADRGMWKIQRANLDGSEVEDVIPPNSSQPYAIALDALGGKIYWTDTYNDDIRRANLDGSGIEVLLVLDGDYSRIALIDRDCNGNGVFDDQDIANETSADCDGNGVPDECQPDCDGDGTPDPGELPPCGTSTDCNENGVPDECEPDCDGDGTPNPVELPPCGTSPDCNENGVPDECEPGGLDDCNANGTYDLCDIYLGTSGDCNGNAIPDDCDVDPSDPDGNGEVSPDEDGNGYPDECCAASSPAPDRLDLPGDPVSRKPRYISFHAGDTGRTQAVRVTCVDLSAPYDTWNGVQLYVQEPELHCENAGSVWPYGGPCPAQAGGLPQTWFWGATLGCDPWWGDWTLYNVVHVYHEGIVPGAAYDIQVVGQMCDPTDESSYSDPYRATTSVWVDVVGDCTTVPCGPPNGIVGIVDVTAQLDKFKNLPGNIQKVRGDIEGSPAGDHRIPDQYSGITDVTYCLGAFLGDSYPGPGFPPPNPPPSCP